MTDFGYQPEYTVGHDSTETPRVTLTPIGEGEAGHRTGIDVKKGESIRVVLPEGVTAANWRVETVTLPMPEPTQEDVVRGAVLDWARSGAHKMPFLPIEQLPKEWKDGRLVLMKDDKRYYVARYHDGKPRSLACGITMLGGVNGWFEYNGYNSPQSPTNFCPMALE